MSKSFDELKYKLKQSKEQTNSNLSNKSINLYLNIKTAQSIQVQFLSQTSILFANHQKH